jgi:hypothetical protein
MRPFVRNHTKSDDLLLSKPPLIRVADSPLSEIFATERRAREAVGDGSLASIGKP